MASTGPGGAGSRSSRGRDGWDTIDWIAAQPWCDGNIGMAGESYHGLTQWAVAGAGHPNLRCVAPGDTVPDLYQAAYPGGAFALMTMGEWAYEMNARRLRNPFRFDPWHLPLIEADDAAGARSRVFKEFVTHCRRDAYWEKRDLSRAASSCPACTGAAGMTCSSAVRSAAGVRPRRVTAPAPRYSSS